MDTGQTIIWRRLDKPGHESARLFQSNSHFHLDGTAVFLYDQQPCRLDYQLVCDSQWQTLSGKIAGWVGDKVIGVEIATDSAGRWWLDGGLRSLAHRFELINRTQVFEWVAASGVSAIVQDAPPSVVRRTRQRVEAPVPIHAWSRPNTATLVPLPAKAPSFESAGGNLSGGTRTHVFPPSLVVRMSNLPSS